MKTYKTSSIESFKGACIFGWIILYFLISVGMFVLFALAGPISVFFNMLGATTLLAAKYSVAKWFFGLAVVFGLMSKYLDTGKKFS
jgi:hypothetical protein